MFMQLVSSLPRPVRVHLLMQTQPGLGMHGLSAATAASAAAAAAATASAASSAAAAAVTRTTRTAHPARTPSTHAPALLLLLLLLLLLAPRSVELPWFVLPSVASPPSAALVCVVELSLRVLGACIGRFGGMLVAASLRRRPRR